MRPRSWLDDEPRLGVQARRAAELFAQGLRKPIAVLVVTGLCALLLVSTMALSKTTYAPKYVLRVVETERNPAEQPAAPRQLAEYVQQGVFTSAPLLDLIRRHGLYPSLVKKSTRAALDAFREDIDVDVYQNYFVEERSSEMAPRSARLAVSYKSPNRELAVAVTRDLGALIVEHERIARREQSARAAAFAREQLDRAEEVLASRRAEIVAKGIEVDRSGSHDIKTLVELIDMTASLQDLEKRQDESEKREASLAVGAALEARGLGLSFDVVKDGSLPTQVKEHETQLILAGASLLFGLPIIVLGVGAFDGKRGLS